MPGHAERRDALAQDWPVFMRAALPGCPWLPIPNVGENASCFFKDWGLTGLILTGGEDVGSVPERDAAEWSLVRTALREGLPVLGVCRGMQVLQCFFGGKLSPCPPGSHVNVRHGLRPSGGSPDPRGFASSVNSYHHHGIREADLARDLTPLAISPDGFVEALAGPGLLAVQWHPEREPHPAPQDIDLLRRHFFSKEPTL